MLSNNLTLIALVFLLLGNNSINTTQFLLLLALLSTSGGLNGWFNQNGCNCNSNCNN